MINPKTPPPKLFSPHQIINIVEEYIQFQNSSILCQRHGINIHTLHRWKKKYLAGLPLEKHGGVSTHERILTLLNENKVMSNEIALQKSKNIPYKDGTFTDEEKFIIVDFYLKTGSPTYTCNRFKISNQTLHRWTNTYFLLEDQNHFNTTPIEKLLEVFHQNKNLKTKLSLLTKES